MKKVTLNNVRLKHLNGRPVAVVTMVIDDKAEGVVMLSEIMSKSLNGTIEISNPLEILQDLVVKLGVGA